MKFIWDEKKNNVNINKHGISFEQACLVFSDKNALSLFDEDHYDTEERWITLGQVFNTKILVVVHTYRVIENNKEVIRIISARKATKNEQEQYFIRYER